MLVSFVNKPAPRTARAIEMHLPANFCNVTSSTISRDKMSRKKAINSSFEGGVGGDDSEGLKTCVRNKA